MQNQTQVQSLAIADLFAHPKNPNVMNKSSFAKLVSHIESTGRYEPIVVREHPRFAGKYEIINGHHRVAALSKLEHKQADCVVWDIDDGEALILLQTLNRLKGRDDADKKAALVKELALRFDTKALAKMLPDTQRTIELIAGLAEPKFDKSILAKVYLKNVFFFVDEDQHSVIQRAMAKAIDASEKLPLAKKQAKAIVKICQSYLEMEQ